MARPDTPVNLSEKLAGIEDHWSPRTVMEVNGLELKVSKFKGEFVWHSHAEGDEMFLVLRGELTIELRDRESVRLGPGEMFVVPRGVEHRPVTPEGCDVVLLDPEGALNTGEVEDSELRREAEWA
ncbi:mannose-6-phosphate isomerase [Streptomyces cinnamoneus]|uniref:Mannose-6-phosphate isomerase n=1 Tax=Streptomyces cinnamoneus TaxID=53446 RepID=A0A2G1XIS8_STRCJ|nr:cupin domain-containing protein [Streptomyces cinnamoneus]PHQ51158.1 mannose-6-phosphate isomerase [Streptomyces cinnamoneus]PPT13619.1 cupin domain-containing protein [Streptomyces cinnamoneus]